MIPGPIFVQKAFHAGLIFERAYFRRGLKYYWSEFYFLKWVGLDNKNSLKL